MTVSVHVKNANSVIAAEDVVLFCGLSVLPSSLDEVLSVAVTLSRPLLEHLHCVVVTLGANGLLVCGEHDAGSVNLQPRKQKRVRAACFRFTDDYCYGSESELVFFVFAEEAALCSALPSADSDSRGDSECVRSRR